MNTASVDTAAFQALFAAKPVVKPAAAASRKAASSKGGMSVALLDAKRANNICIILSRIKLSYSEIREAVIHLDADRLKEDCISALLKCVPSDEEVALVLAASEDPSSLGNAERFVLEVGSIPRLQQRLECFAFKQRFNRQLHDLYKDVLTIGSAFRTLRECAPLRQLLATVLQLGNLLNQGSFRAGAEGFKTECLTRLCEVRANESQGTLLEFALSTALGGASGAAVSEEAWEALQELGVKLREASKVCAGEIEVEVDRFHASVRVWSRMDPNPAS
jgi:hypothetical protein